MRPLSRKTVARIDLDAIRQNLDVVKSLAPGSKIAAVVKADAYGHGLSQVLPALDKAEILAVATFDGAQRCRDFGWQGRVLVLEGPTRADDCQAALALAFEMVIHHDSQLALLRQSSKAARQPLWLKLDSGMHRLGFPSSRAKDVHGQITELSGNEPAVLMSHFACADDPHNPMTQAQISVFDNSTKGLAGNVSLANSAAILNFPESHRDIVRPGILLYGVSPLEQQPAQDIGLKPAMTLQCELIAINRVKKGESIGYGSEYSCPKDMNVGVAAIGYGDGYPRSLKSGSPVLVNDRLASLIGRVSMDMITIDLSDQPQAQVGDTVTLWGRGLPLEKVAACAGVIPYELLCGVAARVNTVVESRA